MKTATPGGSQSAAVKQTYRTPTLTVYGDLGALTRTKRGNRNDGTGKPRTRASGGRA